MKAKYFLLTGFLFTLIPFIIYIILFYFQLGADIKSEYWINSSYQYKDFRAKSIKSKKIIIISGSNSLFGINSELIQKKTGYPVVSLAVHASLDIDFLLYKIKEHINDGDIIVMPLEFEFYSRADKISDWFSNNMMTWGVDYIKQLSLIDLGKFIITTKPDRVLKGVVQQLKTNTTNSKITTQKEVIEQLNILWAKEPPKWRGYNYKSLNDLGDINVDRDVLYKKDIAHIGKRINLSSSFITIYEKINNLVKKHHGTLYLTYPVTIKNKLFDLSQEESQERINNLESLLKHNEIDIQCNAALFQLDSVYFFNNHYHPNKNGALIRSENLADCLNRLKSKEYKKLSYTEAINQTKILEKKYTNVVKIPNFKKRFVDLTMIKKALERYYQNNQKYPISSGYDGLYTKWGKEGKNWIKGLSPKYIKSLPRDPRNINDGGKQYLYKSNGKDYKLIVHSPEDCKTVKAIHPKLIDPKRDCYAYGFWTDRAQEW